MANSNIITGVTIILWLLLIFLGTYLAKRKRKNTFEDYILANRGFNYIIVSFGLLGSYIGGGTLIAVTGQIATQGIVYLIFPIGVALSFFLYGILAKFYREKGLKQTYFIENDSPTSLVDRFVREYGENVRFVSAVVVIFIMIAFMAVQLRAGGIILSEMTNTSSTLSIFIIFVVINLYLYFGGARADAYTDIIQVLFVLTAIVGVTIYLTMNNEILPLMSEVKLQNPELLELSKSSYIIFIGFLILPIITMHTDVGLQQKLLLAKNDNHAKYAGILASIIYLFFGILLVLLSILASSYSSSMNSSDSLFVFFISSQNVPILTIIFYVAILSAITSTIDSEAIVCSTIVMNDIIYKKSKNIKNVYSKTRLWSIASLVCGLILTLAPIKLFDFLSMVWITALAAFSVPVCGLIFTKIKVGLTPNFVKWMILWSVFAVLFYSIYLQFFIEVEDLTMEIIPLSLFIFIVNLLVTIFNYQLEKRKYITK